MSAKGAKPNQRAKHANGAFAIHHCLKYISEDAQNLGLNQTASLLSAIADFAADEAENNGSVRVRRHVAGPVIESGWRR